MAYANEALTITFKKPGRYEKRTYCGVPMNVAYGLFKANTASEVLSFYAKNVRKKFKVIKR